MADEKTDPTSTAKVSSIQGESVLPPLDFTARAGKDVPPRRAPKPTARRGGAGTQSTPSNASVSSPSVDIRAGMTEFYAGIGMMVGMADPTIGKAMVENAEQMAASWEAVAAESPVMRNVAEKLLTASAWGGFVTAHLPLGMACAQSFAMRRAANAQRKAAAKAKVASPTVPPVNEKQAA